MSNPPPSAVRGGRSGRPFWRRGGRAGKATSAPSIRNDAEPLLVTTLATTLVAPPIHNASIPTQSTAPPPSPKHLSSVRFRDFHEAGKISDVLFNAIPFDFCTEVQAKTMDTVLAGEDLLARAKTGTGKTLAFLLPAIQILSTGPQPRKEDISILVLAPTRELAMQIETEAKVLLRGQDLQCQFVVGGTNIASERTRLNSQRADILVATPGRFLDHINNYGLAPKLGRLRWLVLDEADRLLDQGFRKALEEILSALPDRNRQPRQTLLFSATVSNEVRNIATLALLPRHKFISTVADSDESTHTHVKQEYIIAELENVLPLLAQTIDSCLQTNPNAKIMCFLTTARATGLAFELFAKLAIPNLPIFQIHSRMSQAARTKSTEAFRTCTKGVLFSSDVTARGIDVPNVTTVLQVGLPADGEQYVHRLGRTARAGLSGNGVLILSPFERFFLNSKEIRSLPLVEHADSAVILASPSFKTWCGRVDVALDELPDPAKAQAYQAWLGFYKAYLRSMGWSAEELIQGANSYALQILKYKGDADGKPPPLLTSTIGKMGLKPYRGMFNISKEESRGRRTTPSVRGVAGERADAPGVPAATVQHQTTGQRRGGGRRQGPREHT